MNNHSDHDLYTIPPNFIGSSTFLGGMFKVLNVIEAGILALAIGIPVFSFLPFNLTVRIIILCLTALPASLFALIGIGGECLSSFVINFVKYLANRRVLTVEAPDKGRKKRNQKGTFEKKEETEVNSAATLNLLSEYIPVSKIENGIIYTKDRRYVKVLEIIPINFLLRSAREQRNIIYSFVSYLKICPAKVQFKVLTRRADINQHIETVRREMKNETNDHSLVEPMPVSPSKRKPTKKKPSPPKSSQKGEPDSSSHPPSDTTPILQTASPTSIPLELENEIITVDKNSLLHN